jgi:hypothetical protein
MHITFIHWKLLSQTSASLRPSVFSDHEYFLFFKLSLFYLQTLYTSFILEPIIFSQAFSLLASSLPTPPPFSLLPIFLTPCIATICKQQNLHTEAIQLLIIFGSTAFCCRNSHNYNGIITNYKLPIWQNFPKSYSIWQVARFSFSNSLPPDLLKLPVN